MGTFNFLGIPVTIGGGSDLVEKYNRYTELANETDAADDNPGSVKDWGEWGKKVDERIELFNQLEEVGVDFSEPEEKSGGFLGWLFG